MPAPSVSNQARQRSGLEIKKLARAVGSGELGLPRRATGQAGDAAPTPFFFNAKAIRPRPIKSITNSLGSAT